jgi:hypothetical protein
MHTPKHPYTHTHTHRSLQTYKQQAKRPPHHLQRRQHLLLLSQPVLQQVSQGRLARKDVNLRA